MAKLLGQIATGLTIAALFRTAFEAFDIFETTRTQDTTLRKLKLRLDVEKCRLYLWGESMGLTDLAGPEDDGLRFPRTARHILEDLVELFRSAERVKEKYGVGWAGSVDGLGLEEGRAGVVGGASDRGGGGSWSGTARVKRTVTWVVYDRRKFVGLVEEIRLLVDRLKEVTSPPVVVDGVDEVSRRELGRVRDTEALAAVAGVCAVDHPDVIRLRRLGPLLYRVQRGGDGDGSGNGSGYRDGNGNGNGNGFLRSTRHRYGNPRL